MKSQKSILVYSVLIVSFVTIAFFISFNITDYFVNKNLLNNNQKLISNVIENEIKDNILAKKYRFSTFFTSTYKPIFNNINNYRKSYTNFNKGYESFYKEIEAKFIYINKSLNEKNSLPVFSDKESGFLFYPVAYIKYENSRDIKAQINKIFSNNYQYINIEQEKILDSKFLNYIYFEDKNNRKTILLISSPLDPDPLYPDNKRAFFIINSNSKNKDGSVYIKSFILKNLES